jgi:5-formyltetrahydrofolate cyclo-ligase
MFDSLGLGELGLILVVALIFIDPSKIGTLARGLATLRRKWSNLQRDVKQQFDALTLEENLRESADAVRTAKAGLRREALDAVRALTALERATAADKALESLKGWSVYQEARTVALFCGTRDEIDTEAFIRHALAAGKTVLLPRVAERLAGEQAGRSIMHLVSIRDYDRDLTEGAFGILEPREGLSGESPTSAAADLILVPGTAFDERGGRVGRGKGFYDRFLEGYGGFKAGLAFEVQIVRKKLPLEPHDQLLDALVTERRLLEHAQARTA